jgi:hypothetical protein
MTKRKQPSQGKPLSNSILCTICNIWQENIDDNWKKQGRGVASPHDQKKAEGQLESGIEATHIQIGKRTVREGLPVTMQELIGLPGREVPMKGCMIPTYQSWRYISPCLSMGACSSI